MIGGYAVANTLSVAVVAVVVAASGRESADHSDAVLSAMHLSFILYVAAVMWAFAARSALMAWAVPVGIALLAVGVAWIAL